MTATRLKSTTPQFKNEHSTIQPNWVCFAVIVSYVYIILLLSRDWISTLLQSKFAQRSTYNSKYTAAYDIYGSVSCKNCRNAVLPALFSHFSSSKSRFSLKFIVFLIVRNFSTTAINVTPMNLCFNQFVKAISEESQIQFSIGILDFLRKSNFCGEEILLPWEKTCYFCTFEYPSLGLFLVYSYYLTQPGCSHEICLSTKISK